MGIQDFTNGGFYGKVGNIVGLRWKNLYTIRQYKIPTDPKTEAQQACRNNFKTATLLAQIASAINPNTELFNSETMTSFNSRIQTACKYMTDGLGFLQCIPIIPYDFEYSPTITKVALESETTTGTVSFSLTASETYAGYTFVIMLTNDDTTASWENIIIATATADSASSILTGTIPTTFTITENSTKIRLISQDETIGVAGPIFSDALTVQ